ncbi:MAG: FAD-binding oxidoreductase [Hellea sp.]
MIKVKNWKQSIEYNANSVELIRSVEQLQRIVKDKENYPSPVRAKGSHHSTTRCIVAENGTVIDLSEFNQIKNIDKDNLTITMQAGVQLIDAAKALEELGLQFYTNIELGNLTMGSGATGGTKDASYHDNGDWEFGQVCSYCVGMKTVQADGSLLEVTGKSDPDLMAAMRTGFGLLGIAYEVTFQVKEISAMAVEHETYAIDDFTASLDDIIARKKSVMLYLFPFLDRVVVEYRYDTDEHIQPHSFVWWVRNFTWKSFWPLLANLITLLPSRRLRFWITNTLNSLTVWTLKLLLKERNSSPASQIIRYSKLGGFASYTFSIWAFSRDDYPKTLKKYFAFCKGYYRDTGYRCDMLNVGYHIAQDRNALFSYTRDWPALTIDPVSSGSEGWEEFLVAYNEFCSENNGRPLFNQTGRLTPEQVSKAFGKEIVEFRNLQNLVDPENRFYNPFFKTLFSDEAQGPG